MEVERESAADSRRVTVNLRDGATISLSVTHRLMGTVLTNRGGTSGTADLPRLEAKPEDAPILARWANATRNSESEDGLVFILDSLAIASKTFLVARQRKGNKLLAKLIFNEKLEQHLKDGTWPQICPQPKLPLTPLPVRKEFLGMWEESTSSFHQCALAALVLVRENDAKAIEEEWGNLLAQHHIQIKYAICLLLKAANPCVKGSDEILFDMYKLRLNRIIDSEKPHSFAEQLNIP